MFKNTLQGDSKNTYICLEKGINLTDVCEILSEKYHVELYQSGSSGTPNVLVIEKK